MAAQTCGTRPIYIEPWKPRGDYLQNGDDVRLKRKARDKNGVALGPCRTILGFALLTIKLFT